MTDGDQVDGPLAAAELFEPGWQRALGRAQVAGAAACLERALRDEAESGSSVHPAPDRVFAAFELTPFDQVRVVIVGQDPYHGPGQATGLAFSVSKGVAIPPSLRNILTELESDVGVARPPHGDLSAWADRGVLLLNTALTVRAGQAASHARIGWEPFTDAAIRAVGEDRDGVAFVLWGRHAQRRARLIDPSRHLVLASAHPSPLSARTGFFGSRPFSRINAWLEERGEQPIDWSLPMR